MHMSHSSLKKITLSLIVQRAEMYRVLDFMLTFLKKNVLVTFWDLEHKKKINH